MNSRERFNAAIQKQKTDRPPVWIMRQAGRYLPEYRELRQKMGSFKALYRNPETATEVLMQPLRRFALDAGILFSDILVIPEAFGIAVEFKEGGPVLDRRIETMDDVKQLHSNNLRKSLDFTNLSLQASRSAMGNNIALIGFSGAPYTLASYMVEGGTASRTSKLKRMLYEKPDVLHALLERLTDAVIDYLLMQGENDIDAVQLFDTWAGDLHPLSYNEFVFPYVQKIVDELQKHNMQVIYYINGCAALLPTMSKLSVDVMGIDWRLPMDTALQITEKKFTLQGNFDPLELFAEAQYIRTRVHNIHESLKGHPYIMNLGHGILPQTPIDGVQTFVKEVLALG